jgi:hypothetical protein
MTERLILFVLGALFALASSGQTPKPDFTYFLHATAKENGAVTALPSTKRHSSELDMLPDNSLLEIIPQGNSHWVLKRLSYWDTRTPREETVAIDAAPGETWEFPPVAHLLVNSNATYAFAMITSSTPSAMVVIDLKTFKVVNRIATNDRHFSDFDSRISPDGLIVNKDMKRDDPHFWELTAIQIPRLEVVADCDYPDTPQSEDESADTRCATLLTAAEIPSVTWFDRPMTDPQRTEIEAAIGKIPNCGLVSWSADVEYALYDCITQEHATWDTLKTTSRGVMVFDMSDRQPIINMQLPTSYDVSFGLARSEGKDYMVMLKKAVKLEVYRLP